MVSDGIRLCFCSERGVSGVSHKGSCVKPVCAERIQLLLCRINKNKHKKTVVDAETAAKQTPSLAKQSHLRRS